MTRKAEFPKKIYVVRETPAVGESFLVIYEDMEDAIGAAEHGGKVCIYDKLVVRTAEIARTFKE